MLQDVRALYMEIVLKTTWPYLDKWQVVNQTFSKNLFLGKVGLTYIVHVSLKSENAHLHNVHFFQSPSRFLPFVLQSLLYQSKDKDRRYRSENEDLSKIDLTNSFVCGFQKCLNINIRVISHLKEKFFEVYPACSHRNPLNTLPR